jgi:hypothetical protein
LRFADFTICSRDLRSRINHTRIQGVKKLWIPDPGLQLWIENSCCIIILYNIHVWYFQIYVHIVDCPIVRMGDSVLLASKESEEFCLDGEEEDLDAFNLETFGGEAAEWEESGMRIPVPWY